MDYRIKVQVTELAGLPPQAGSNLAKLSPENLAGLFKWQPGQVLRFSGFNGSDPHGEAASMAQTIYGFARSFHDKRAGIRIREEDNAIVLYSMLRAEALLTEGS